MIMDSSNLTPPFLVETGLSEGGLADLSVKPKEDVPLAVDDTDDLMDEILREKVDAVETEDLARRAKEFEKKLEKGERKEETSLKNVAPGDAKRPTRVPVIPQKITSPVKGQKARARVSAKKLPSSARIALATMSESASAPSVVKPIETPAPEPPALGKQGKGKGKEKGLSTPEEIGKDLWGDQPTPKLGDEGFPVSPVPQPSGEYSVLSVASSQYEAVGSEMAELAHEIKQLRSMFKDHTVKTAKVEVQLEAMREDASKFQGYVMDRFREISRKEGNLPSSATKAKDVSPVGETSQQENEQKPPPRRLTREELLAKARKVATK